MTLQKTSRSLKDSSRIWIGRKTFRINFKVRSAAVVADPPVQRNKALPRSPIVLASCWDVSISPNGQNRQVLNESLCFVLARQLPSHVDPFGRVEAEKVARGSADRRESSDRGLNEFKVFLPTLGSRVETHLHSACFRIKRRHIGAFIPVAVRTCQRQILGFFCAAVLPSENVFDVEANGGDYRLRQTTVLTCVVGTDTNVVSDRCVHGLLPVVRLKN